MHVTKVVDLFAKIPEHLSLHFSDFSMSFKRIYKFAVFENKKELQICAKAPEKNWGFTTRPLAGLSETGEGRRPDFR